MRCPNCGVECEDNIKFCGSCGSKIENVTVVENPVYVEENVQNNQPPEEKNGFIITIIIVFILLMLGGVVWYFLINNSKTKYSSKDEIGDKGDVSINIDDDSGEKEKKINFGDYSLKVPTGWNYDVYNGNVYIQNNECIIMIMSYTLDYESLLSNKESFVQSLRDQGYVVDKFDTRKMDGIDFIIVTGSLDGVGYGYMFADLDSSSTIFLTITSSGLGSFDESWFNYGSSFVATAEKEK